MFLIRLGEVGSGQALEQIKINKANIWYSPPLFPFPPLHSSAFPSTPLLCSTLSPHPLSHHPTQITDNKNNVVSMEELDNDQPAYQPVAVFDDFAEEGNRTV